MKTLQITEKQFMVQVVKLARLRGWMVYHTFDSRRSAAGFPDICAVRARDGKLIFAELKKDRNAKATLAQCAWLKDLRETKADVYLWTPDDWDAIEEILK